MIAHTDPVEHVALAVTATLAIAAYGLLWLRLPAPDERRLWSWVAGVAVLVVARLLQGLGGAAGMVIGRAVISDLATGKPAARAFSLMMIVGGVAPVVAPLLGGLLTGPIGWRGLLTIVLGLAVVMLVACTVVIRASVLGDELPAHGALTLCVFCVAVWLWIFSPLEDT